MNMPPETENFSAYHLLKAIEETQGDDHYGYTDSRGGNRQPDDKPGECPFAVER